jgi:2,3-bisphosphoglycerate-independent phosphoglycerate mutase
MKIAFIVIDGLGDRPIPALGNKTPLEAAKTPNLDWLAKNGICGLIQPFQFPGQKYPESDTCHLALFGYNPKIYYLGRGPYEAAGIGVKLKAGDVALRMNFATVDKNLKVIDRRAGRINKTQPLARALNGIKIEGVKFLVKKSYGHRAVLVLRSKNLSERITDSDPKKIGEPLRKMVPSTRDRALKGRQLNKAEFTAQVLNKFLEKAHFILKNHPLNKKRELAGLLPANYLLIRGAGKFKKTPSFYQKYRLKAVCIAGGALYKGIAKILGMKLIKVKGATGYPTTNLKGKFQAVRRVLRNYDFVFCHIKAADNLGEDGNFRGKKEFLEKIDKNIKPLLNLKNVLIVVTGDHSTCCLLKRHCPEPVPLLISGRDLRTDNVSKFSEKACRKGRLGKIKQLNLFSRVQRLYKK